MPNAWIPSEFEGKNIYLCSPEYMAEYTKRFILNGVKVVGGCCGTAPSHIEAMRRAIKVLQLPETKRIQVLPPTEIEAVEKIIKLRNKSKMARKVEDKKFVVGIEIVAPKDHDPSRIVEIARKLDKKGIDCVNISDGPRASARMSSMALSYILSLKTKIEPILHYTCRDRNLLELQSDLLGMYAQGIRNILIITGGPLKLGDYPDATAVFDVDSIGLTNVVNSLNKGIDIGSKRLSEPKGFHIGVGPAPELSTSTMRYPGLS